MSKRVFISWSGKRSKHVAEALREWLPYVLQDVEPFVSSINIQAGELWDDVIRERVRTSGFCILCVTSGNLRSEWLHYEAGAMREGMAIPVAPFLLGVGMEQLSGPFRRLQAKHADEAGTTELILSLGQAIKTSSSEAFIRNAVSKNWGDLKSKLDNAPTDDESVVATVSPDLGYLPRTLSDDSVVQLIQAKLDTLHETTTLLFADVERELRLPAGSAQRVFVQAVDPQRFKVKVAGESVRLEYITPSVGIAVVGDPPRGWGRGGFGVL